MHLICRSFIKQVGDYLTRRATSLTIAHTPELSFWDLTTTHVHQFNSANCVGHGRPYKAREKVTPSLHL